jgi:hypothetical protein
MHDTEGSADQQKGSMATIVETKNLADLYGLPPVDWAAVTAPLDRGVTQAPETGGPDRHTTWLTTINGDGSPHVTGVGALWVDGTFWFVTGERTRKGRNLARDPRCAIAVSLRESDLVFGGDAQPVTDPPIVTAMAERWAAGAGRAVWTRRVGHAPPTTARLSRTTTVVRLPHHHRGSSTASPRGRQPRSRRSTPAVRPGGGSIARDPARSRDSRRLQNRWNRGEREER